MLIRLRDVYLREWGKDRKDDCVQRMDGLYALYRSTRELRGVVDVSFGAETSRLWVQSVAWKRINCVESCAVSLVLVMMIVE